MLSVGWTEAGVRHWGIVRPDTMGTLGDGMVEHCRSSCWVEAGGKQVLDAKGGDNRQRICAQPTAAAKQKPAQEADG